MADEGQQLILVGDATELASGPGRAALRLPDGHEVVAFRDGAGCWRAVENLCPHRGGPLGLGSVHGEVVSCPWHRFRFSLRSGACVDTESVLRVRVYPVREREGRVFIVWNGQQDVALHSGSQVGGDGA